MEAARTMFVISRGSSRLTRTFELPDGVQKPIAALFGEIDAAYLLTGVDHQSIGSGDPQLVLDVLPGTPRPTVLRKATTLAYLGQQRLLEGFYVIDDPLYLFFRCHALLFPVELFVPKTWA